MDEAAGRLVDWETNVMRTTGTRNCAICPEDTLDKILPLRHWETLDLHAKPRDRVPGRGRRATARTPEAADRSFRIPPSDADHEDTIKSAVEERSNYRYNYMTDTDLKPRRTWFAPGRINS